MRLPSPEDIRAARAYKGWNQKEFGTRCGLSPTAIANIESRRFRPTSENLEKIARIFWEHDLEFVEGGGFRTRQDLVQIYESYNGIIGFFEDIFYTALSGEKEFLVYGVDEKKFIEARQKSGIGNVHRDRMNKLEGVEYKVIISENDGNEHGADYVTYRALPDEMILSDAPFYIYGNKVAFIVWREPPKIIVLKDLDLVEAYKRQFYFLWKSANPL